MPRGRARRPVSQRQARFFGAIAGGALKKKGFPAKAAKDDLRGVKVKKLPKKKKKKR